MALSSLRVKTNYDNEPYVRSLTATLQWNPNAENTWVAFDRTEFPMLWEIAAEGLDTAFDVYALNRGNLNYPLGSLDDVIDINPIIFKFAAPYYDPTRVRYSLNSFAVSAQVVGSNFTGADENGNNFATSAVAFDNFPFITADLSVNYESTSRNNRFYRLINPSPLPVSIKITSSTLPLTTTLNGSYYKTTLLVNNVSVPALTTVSNFNRTTFPTICTVQATVSAVSCIGSLTSFYTPHTLLLNSISAIFVNSFPVAEFVAYPSFYFTNSVTPPTELTPLNFATLSPGVCFYGEGHTEKINLSARTVSGITNYIWKDITNKPFVNVSNNVFNTNTNTLSVSSAVGSYPTIPIGLQITNSLFPSAAPIIGYNDTDGTPFFYPYYTSTVDTSGNEYISNTNLKQSINVVPYDPISYRFYPGTDSSNVFLPADGNLASFTASIAVGFNGPQTVLPCFDKYGINWQWSAFTGCNTNPSSFNNAPSSWSTTASAGTYPRRWYKECNTTYDNCSAGTFNTTPVGCIGSVAYWSLSTADWQNISTSLTPLTGDTFNYKLNFANPYNKVARTFSPAKATPMLVTVTETITCQISATPFDWKPKVTTVNAASALNILGTPVLRLYTPNKYMLTGTDVKFENIIQNAGFLTDLTVIYGSEDLEYLTGSNVTNNLVHRYTTTGLKSITLSGNVSYGGSLIKTFPNIVNIVNSYDEIDEERFITQDTPLIPPYITKPLIAPNDNAVANNINDIISKIYDNLSYLEKRGKVYPNKTSESYGWLGVPQLPELPQITGYTWQDFYRIDCLEADITWNDLACVGPSSDIPVYVPPPVTAVNTGLVSIGKQKYVIDIKSNTNNVDLITEIGKLTPTWNKISPIDVTVNVYPNVTVESNNINLYALTLNSLPVRSTLVLNNSGTITGIVGSSTAGSAAFSSSQNWTVPAGVNSLSVQAGGGGGGGGGGHEQGNGQAGGGGGGGGYSTGTLSVTPGQVIAVTVGGGGAGGGGGGRGDAAGGSGGGSSSVGSIVGGGGGGAQWGGGGGSGGSGNVANGGSGSSGSRGSGDRSDGSGGSGGGGGGGGAGAGGAGASFWDRSSPLSWRGNNGGGGRVNISYTVYKAGGPALLIQNANTVIKNSNGVIAGGRGGDGSYGTAITGITNSTFNGRGTITGAQQ